MAVSTSSHTSGFIQRDPDPRVPELSYMAERWLDNGQWNTDWKCHNYWEIHCQVEGSMTWYENELADNRRSPGGSFVVVAPGMGHRCEAPSGESQHFFSCGIRLDRFFGQHPDLAQAWQLNHCAVYDDAHSLQPIFRALAKEICLHLPGRSRMIAMQVEALFIEISRVMLSRCEVIGEARPLHPAVARTRELLDNNPSGDWNLPYLSRIAGIAPTYLAHLFKVETGVSPKQYVKRLRLTLARDMLINTDKSVTAISRDLGFCNSQYFATRFKQAYQMTPLEMRQKQFPEGQIPEPNTSSDELEDETEAANCAESSQSVSA